MPERHYESANEEFSRRVKELYQLAEKMNLFLQIKVRPKHTLDPEDPPIQIPGGPKILMTPAVGEDYWIYRVKLKHGQSILAFPKFGTIGCGFAKEEDWNTNLPLLSGSPEMIFAHIKHNKKFADIPDADCIAAIKALQEFHQSRITNHESL